MECLYEFWVLQNFVSLQCRYQWIEFVPTTDLLYKVVPKLQVPINYFKVITGNNIN